MKEIAADMLTEAFDKLRDSEKETCGKEQLCLAVGFAMAKIDDAMQVDPSAED